MKHNAKGLFFVMVFAFAATAISDISWFKNLAISPLIIGIVLGMVYANTVKKRVSHVFEAGIHFSTKTILRLGIIFYGFRLTFQNIQDVGIAGVLIAFIVVATTFVLGYFIGIKVLKLDRETTILTSAGSAICGAAAVLATESVLKSQAHKSAIAVSTVVVFGTVSMFLYPFLYKMGIFVLNENAMGVYIGATLHEVAHVVGASTALGQTVAQNAVIVKMIRVMMLAPFLLVLSFWMIKSTLHTNTTKQKITIPWFAVFFIVVVGFNSFDFVPVFWLDIINETDTFLLTMAMSALGMQTSYDKFQQVGAKPVYLASILFVWLIVGGYFLVKLFLS
ncbi:MAG: YeiH family protein [Candidatus Marinarcus sp.]|uniref:YeiH family protein n=1 Tax=Candidatus Marinarcus sp. TaxID=3100987 RepID=UPI003B00F84F